VFRPWLIVDNPVVIANGNYDSILKILKKSKYLSHVMHLIIVAGSSYLHHSSRRSEDRKKKRNISKAKPCNGLLPTQHIKKRLGESFLEPSINKGHTQRQKK
jgi:hypothetical protein